MTTSGEPTVAASGRLLLATDLSARCDRALERAAQLAAEWRCTLLALNVLDPTAALDQALAWAQGEGDARLLGSTAATLLDWLPCDTLLVRPPATRA